MKILTDFLCRRKGMSELIVEDWHFYVKNFFYCIKEPSRTFLFVMDFFILFRAVLLVIFPESASFFENVVLPI